MADAGHTFFRDVNPLWPRLQVTLQEMLGRSIREFDPRVPERRGCAAFISAGLRNSFGLPIYDVNVNNLEGTLKKNGFRQVALSELQPGDIILGNRGNGKPGHAAFYAGNGQIVDNGSNERRIRVASTQVFASNSFKRVVAYRPMA